VYNKKLYLFLLVCFPLVIVASEAPETPEFLKAFYKDVDPEKMHMGLTIYPPHENNKRVFLSFVLHNDKDNANDVVDDNYKNISDIYTNTLFKMQKNNNMYDFLVNDFVIARISHETLYAAVANFKTNNPLPGWAISEYQVHLNYLLEGKQFENYKKYHRSAIKDEYDKLLIMFGQGITDFRELQTLDLIHMYGTMKKFEYSVVEELTLNVIKRKNYNTLSAPLEKPKRMSMEQLTSQRKKQQKSESKTKIEQPHNNRYYYIGCSILILLLTFLALNKITH
jgi:hypothetical protein